MPIKNHIVSLENKSSIQNILSLLIDDIEQLTKEKKHHTFDYRFGTEIEGEFQSFEYPEELKKYQTEEEIHSSELQFFYAAIRYEDLIPEVENYIHKIIQTGNAHNIWSDDENSVGLQASFILALADKKHLELYQDLLMQLNMDHEVYQASQIEILAQKWGHTNEFLQLLAARCTSLCGQFGLEQFEAIVSENRVPQLLNSEYQKKFQSLLYEEVKKMKCYRLCHPQRKEIELQEISEYFLIPALEIINISITEEELIKDFLKAQ